MKNSIMSLLGMCGILGVAFTLGGMYLQHLEAAGFLVLQ